MTSRIGDVFQHAKDEGRLALLSLVIPGFPDPAGTDAVFDAMVAGGADIVEVEIPFSDPLADGPTIQNAAYVALQNGTTPAMCIDFARRAHARHPDTSILFMSYLNPVLAYGLDAFARDAHEAGASAVILVDLPPEEAARAKAAFAVHGLDLIFLVAPTSTDKRIELICSMASGFIYCVTIAGVTGARNALPSDLRDFVGRVRRCTNLPLAVGFGLSRREHVEAMAGVADGAVVASAFIDLIAKSEPEERAKAVRDFTEVLTGRRKP